jgi:hypothetical protein
MLGSVHHRLRISVAAPVVLLALAVLALLLASSSTRGAVAVARCGPATGQTLAADKAARVYALGNTVYGCALGGMRSYRLGQRQTCIGTSRAGPAVTVAGRLAAYGLSRCGVDTGFTQVLVRRLTDGTQLRAVPATSPPGPESFQSVDSLVLKADGAVAWIGTGRSIVGHGKVIEVRKADRGGAALLDSGAAVDSGSLRLRHSKLTWKHGGETRSATLQ